MVKHLQSGILLYTNQPIILTKDKQPMKAKAKEAAMRFTTFLAEKLHKLGMKSRYIEQEAGITNGTLSKNTER